MKKATLVVSGYLQKNSIFDANKHRDNIFDRFIKLKHEFALHDYDLSTDDINSILDADIIIYANNMPNILPRKENIHKSYLILSESQFIRPDNYDLEKHQYFKRVFTWRDDLVDNKKYFKLNYAHLFPGQINKNLDKKTKLCTLIAGNKKPRYLKNLDLYAHREKAIRWFEQNHPEDFDLYGVGWDKYYFRGPKLVRVFNRIPWFAKLYMKLVQQGYPSYKGVVDNKKTTMESYKYSICYENARDIPGYITEKIFDSFFAGCIPVYWGANNVTDFIPENCFIDKREFSSYEDLYKYMLQMSDKDYLNYIDNIQAYLNSIQAFPYKSEGFVQTLVKVIFDNQGEN